MHRWKNKNMIRAAVVFGISYTYFNKLCEFSRFPFLHTDLNTRTSRHFFGTPYWMIPKTSSLPRFSGLQPGLLSLSFQHQNLWLYLKLPHTKRSCMLSYQNISYTTCSPSSIPLSSHFPLILDNLAVFSLFSPCQTAPLPNPTLLLMMWTLLWSRA